MPSYNQLTLIGHTTRDIATRTTPNNTQIADGGIAVNHKYTVNNEKREEVMFMDFTAFGKVAEIIAKYINKGDAVMLVGRVVYETWNDKQSGAKRSKHKLNVEQVRLLGGRSDDQRGGGADRDERRQPASAGAGRQEPQDTGGGYGDGMDQSDIPFAPDRPRDL